MISKLFKNKKFLLATILIAGLFLIFSTKSVQACNIITNGTACIEELVTYLVQSITLMIFSFLGKAINIVAQFLFPIIYLGNQAIGSPLVKQGFKICLQIANLGFVVSIIYVAFATITKFNDYKIKDFLIKLITAAVLINFSFAIAGTVMDVSNVVGNYFLAKSIPGGNLEGFSEQMANAFNLGKLNAVKPGPNEGFTDNLSSLGRSFLNLIFSLGLSIFVSIIVLLTFLGIMGMMLARYLWMVILLTCMPIIWLCYMSPFPSVKSYFGKWWSMFGKWIYFYHITSFFLYLALLTATTTTNGTSSAVYTSSTAQEINKTILNESGLAGLIDAIVKAGLFLAALYLGSQAGGGFMNTTMSWAKGATNKMIGAYKGVGMAPIKGAKYIGQGARRYGTGLLRSNVPFIGGKQNIEAMQSLGGNIKGWKGVVARGLLNATGIRPAARLAGNALEAASSGKNIKAEAEARLKDRSHDDLARNFQALTDIEKMVAMERAKKDDKLDKYDVVDYLAKANKDTWEKFGSTKDFEAIEKKIGVNQEMAKALQDNDKDGYNKAASNFYSGLYKKDFGEIMSDSVKKFNKDNKLYGGSIGEKGFNMFQETMLKERLRNHPGSFGKSISEMSGKQINDFKVRLFGAALSGDSLNLTLEDSVSELSLVKEVIGGYGIPLKDEDISIDAEKNQYNIKNLDKKKFLEAFRDEKDSDKRRVLNKVLMNALKGQDEDAYKSLNGQLGKRILADGEDEKKGEEKPKEEKTDKK